MENLEAHGLTSLGVHSSKQEDPVSNKVESEDQHLGVYFDLHSSVLMHVNTHTHIKIIIRIKRWFSR